MTEHDHAAEPARQRGNQDAVVPTCDHAADGARCIPAEAVGHEPLARGEVVGLYRLTGRPGDAASQFRNLHGRTHAVLRTFGGRRSTRRGAGRNTMAHSPATYQPPSGNASGVPPPPYFGSSLDHSTYQSRSAGGASSGSAIELRARSLPRFTTSSRSSA